MAEAKKIGGMVGEKMVEGENPLLDLVFLMDCTGSMGSYIASAQASIRNICEDIVSQEKADVRLGLISYRDHPPQDSSYVTQVFDFTPSVSKMKKNLDTLSASGGGDGPEAVADALYDALKLDWREKATKIAVLIADAPPHGLSTSGDGFPNGCPLDLDPLTIAGQFAEKGIVLYCVGCEPSITPYKDFFQGLCHITGGQYCKLQSAKVLSTVVINGASEEISLEKLMADVEDEVEKNADVDEEQQAQQVFSLFQKKKAKAKRMKTNQGEMEGVSACAKEVCKSKNMAELRTSYKPSSYSYPSASLSRRKMAAPRKESGGFFTSLFGGGSRPTTESAAAYEREEEISYTNTTESLSMEQCSRMVKKAKARKGMY